MNKLMSSFEYTSGMYFALDDTIKAFGLVSPTVCVTTYFNNF